MSDSCEITGFSKSDIEKYSYLHKYLTNKEKIEFQTPENSNPPGLRDILREAGVSE